MKSNETTTELSLIIRLVKINNSQIEELKDYAASLVTNSHNSTVYSVCSVLPVIMAKVPVAEAEKIASYEFIQSIGDGNKQGHVYLNVSRSAIEADDVNTYLGIDGQGVRIAVLDTGINTHHPDLDDLDDDPTTFDPKVLEDVCFVDLNDDGVPDQNPADDYGHGTHVAGIAAGTGEASNYQFIGVAPDAWIMNIKVAYLIWKDGLPSATFEVDDVENGIDYAISHGADVICLSLGSPETGDGMSELAKAVDDAVEAGVVVVTSIGNDPHSSIVDSPADAFNAITVGAVDDNNTINIEDDVLASFSSHGPTIDLRPKPDVVAPGVNIIASMPNTAAYWQAYPDLRVGNFYAQVSGTSMAASHVAGTVALMLHANPNLTPAQVKAILRQTARLNNNLTGYDLNDRGHGIIDAYAAVQLAQNIDSIDRSQMYDSWEATTRFGYENTYVNFTVDAPDPTFGVSLRDIRYYIDGYRLIWRLSAQHVWINDTYYHLGNGMHKYLFSGPRIFERELGEYVLMRALYKVGNVKIEYFWNIGVDYVLFRLYYDGGSSWKTLIYIDTDIWNETNYPYLPSTSETILIETKITNSDYDNPVNVRDLDHTEYLRIEPY